MTYRSLIVWLFGLIACALSFYAVLIITEPLPPIEFHPPMEILENATVLNDADLSNAIRRAGFSVSEKIRGNIDALTRLPSGKVQMVGWSAEVDGRDPLTIIVFVRGKVALKTQTKGERPDVTAALKLPPLAAKNVVLEGALECGAGESPIVVAISENYTVGGVYNPSNCP